MSTSTAIKLIPLPLIGGIIGIIIVIITQPWTEALGIAYSPLRTVVLFAFTFTALLSWAIYWCILYAKRPEWLVPPDKYVPGMKVKVFSTWTYSGIGVTAALFIAASVLGAPMKIDLAGLTIAALSAYYGSIIALIGMYIGEVIAYGPLAASTAWAVYPGIEILATALLDASIWAYAAYVIYWIRQTNIYKRSRILAILLAMALIEPVHYGFWYIYWFIMNPWPSFVPVAWLNLATWVAWAPILVFIGILIGDQAYILRALKVRGA